MPCSQELEHKFDEFGKVKEARVVRNPATGESRGFGFVALDHDDEVDDVST
jgi:RNA recognition motif-containing protein